VAAVWLLCLLWVLWLFRPLRLDGGLRLLWLLQLLRLQPPPVAAVGALGYSNVGPFGFSNVGTFDFTSAGTFLGGS